MLLLHLFVVGTFTLSIKCYGARPETKRDPLDDLDDSFWSEEASVGEVEKLLRQHKENQDLIRSMGTSSYRLIYPVQLRHHEKLGISTREIGTTKSYDRSLEGSRNERISTQQAGKHFHRTSLLIKAFSHKFRLDLELNTQLLAPNLIQKHFLPGGAEQISKQEIEHCYYHGSVKDYPGATAAFRTCNGVSGVIHVGNETFIIHPFYGGDLSRKHPHVIFEARAKLKQQCGNTGSLEWGLRNYRKGKTPKSVNERYKRDVREVTKYVETALVLDKAMFEKRNGSRRIEVVHDAIQIANIADLYFRTLNTRISVVYIETWASENQALVDKSQDIHRALLNFNDYTSRKLFKVDKDTTQLLSGESFPSGASGMSVPDTICTTKAVGISVDLSPYEPHLVAGTMAHMIGHNVGMGHDDGREDCHCADWHGCIMSQSIVGLDNVQPYKFSECSLSDYVDTLRVGHAICLINRPSILDDFRTCGNGIVEDGEECDCGTIEECHEFDPCCDPITCKLTVEAECASGPCCDDCRLRAKGTLCREATNECDLPEVCNGRSGQCPLDVSKKNGNPCEGGRGYCFGGVCPTLDNQCHQIWGYGGVTADRRCYEQFNSQGSINGHCGVDTTNNYLKCETENVMCGSLQCQMGSRYPIVAGMDQMYSRTIFSMGGKEFECKVISGNVAAATEIPDLGLVRDGTPCGNNLVCVNKTCTSIYSFIDRVKCASNNVALDCSGHGVCSNINTCFCDPGWTGHDCATQTNITYPALMGQGQYGAHDSQGQGALFRTPQPSHGTGQPASTEMPLVDWQKNTTKTTSYVDASGSSTVYLVAMLVSVVGGVFIVFALMALCYRSVVVHRNLSLCVRRKSTMPKYDPPYMKRPLVTPLPAKPATANHMAGGADPSLGLEAGAKGITFGSMPSYRPVTHTNAAGAGGPNVINNFGPTSEEEAGQSGEDETAAFLDGIPNNLSKQPEKGILKKSGPYGHVGIPLTLPLVSGKEKWSEESQSDNQEVISPDSERERERGPSSASIGLSDVERTLKSLNGYHEDILQALRSAASHRSASSASLSDDLRKSFPDHYPDYFPPSEYMLLRGISHDKLAPRSSGGGPSPLGGVAVGGSTAGLLPPAGDSGDEGDLVPPCGPIRIRNLEDLIRQLERHSARHTSPNGSEDIRMSEPEADRHYRLDRLERLDRLDRLDRLESSSNPDTQGHPLRFVYGRYRKPTASSDALTELQEELQQMQELQKLEQLEKLQLQDLADEDLYPSVHSHSHSRGREKLDCAEDSDDSESVEYAGPATVRSSSDDGLIVIPSHPSSNGSLLGNGVVEYRRVAAVDYNDPRAQTHYLRSSNSEESYLEGSNSYEDNLSLPPRSVSEDSSRDTDNVLHSGGYAEYKH